MSDNKHYYYLKLKDNFYDDDKIKFLESLPNGIKYTNLLMKLYLKSLKTNGRLRITEKIPYNEETIARNTNLDIDTVRAGIKALIELNYIVLFDDGTIYMTDIQNFIGKSSTEADRIRAYRSEIDEKKRIEKEKRKLLEKGKVKKNAFTNVQHMYNKCTDKEKVQNVEFTEVSEVVTNVQPNSYICTPEIELEIDLYKEKQHKITDKKEFVKGQNGKNVVVELYIKKISELYTKLTGRYSNHNDIEAVTEILDYPIGIPIDYESRTKIIMETVKIVHREKKKKAPNEGIKSFRYFLTPIKNEFKKYSIMGKENKNARENEYKQKINLNKFSDN